MMGRAGWWWWAADELGTHVREVEGYADDSQRLTDGERGGQPGDKQEGSGQGSEHGESAVERSQEGEGAEGAEDEAATTTADGIRPAEIKLAVAADALGEEAEATASDRGTHGDALGTPVEQETHEVWRLKALRRLSMKQLLNGMRSRRDAAAVLPTHSQPLHVRSVVVPRELDERAAGAQVSLAPLGSLSPPQRCVLRLSSPTLRLLLELALRLALGLALCNRRHSRCAETNGVRISHRQNVLGYCSI